MVVIEWASHFGGQDAERQAWGATARVAQQHKTELVDQLAQASNIQIAILTTELESSRVRRSYLGRSFEALFRYPMPTARGRFEPLTADGGESEAAFHRRAGTALERLITGSDEHVLVVAHGGILNAALHELIRSDRVGFAFGDTGFTTARVDRSRDRVLVLGVNQQPHLT